MAARRCHLLRLLVGLLLPALSASAFSANLSPLPALPAIQMGATLPAPPPGTTQQLAATTQSKLDNQRQINDRLALTLKALKASQSRFQGTPWWDNYRDYCMGDLYSFDRLTGTVYACGGTRCPTTSQMSKDGYPTCDPARRGLPLCNTSDWCQPGYLCDMERAPGVCIPVPCPSSQFCADLVRNTRDEYWKTHK